MNVEQIGGFIRTILAFFGGLIVAKGWIPANLMNEIVGALVALIAAGWSFWTKTTPQMLASVVARKDEVQTVVTTSTPSGRQMAADIPGPSVQSAADVKVVPK